MKQIVFCFTVFCVFSSFEIISRPLFVVAPPIVCWGSVLDPCFALRCFVSFLVLKSSRCHCLLLLPLFVGVQC